MFRLITEIDYLACQIEKIYDLLEASYEAIVEKQHDTTHDVAQVITLLAKLLRINIKKFLDIVKKDKIAFYLLTQDYIPKTFVKYVTANDLYRKYYSILQRVQRMPPEIEVRTWIKYGIDSYLNSKLRPLVETKFVKSSEEDRILELGDNIRRQLIAFQNRQHKSYTNLQDYTLILASI